MLPSLLFATFQKECLSTVKIKKNQIKLLDSPVSNSRHISYHLQLSIVLLHFCQLRWIFRGIPISFWWRHFAPISWIRLKSCISPEKSKSSLMLHKMFTRYLILLSNLQQMLLSFWFYDPKVEHHRVQKIYEHWAFPQNSNEKKKFSRSFLSVSTEGQFIRAVHLDNWAWFFYCTNF